MKGCPFCELIEKGDNYENRNAVAIYDRYPISEGHSLIIPKNHITSFFDLTKEEREDMFDLLDDFKYILDDLYSPDSYNIGINDGKAAGQTIPHCHIHLIPRYKGDCIDPRGGIRWIVPSKAKYW